MAAVKFDANASVPLASGGKASSLPSPRLIRRPLRIATVSAPQLDAAGLGIERQRPADNRRSGPPLPFVLSFEDMNRILIWAICFTRSTYYLPQDIELVVIRTQWPHGARRLAGLVVRN